MCAILLPGNISPLRSKIVLPSVSVSSLDSIKKVIATNNQDTWPDLASFLITSGFLISPSVRFGIMNWKQCWYHARSRPQCLKITKKCLIKKFVKVCPVNLTNFLKNSNLVSLRFRFCLQKSFTRNIVKRDVLGNFQTLCHSSKVFFWLYYVKNCTTLLLWQPWQHQDMKSLFRPMQQCSELFFEVRANQAKIVIFTSKLFYHFNKQMPL